MSGITGGKSIDALANSLEVPISSYDAASKRYHDLGAWLQDRSKAKSAVYGPDVFPQGSFRLGTAIAPWGREDYDLDLVCKLQGGMATDKCSQKDLKALLGEDLHAYRIERRIKDPVEPKHRCWRLTYKDALGFHMDVLPGVPHEADTRRRLMERMMKSGSSEVFAQDVAGLALAITDDRHPNYGRISSDWFISNPEGYARWFESRMRQATQLLKSRATLENVASINDLPVYRWKSPLQRAIQILKRHRDVMFEKNPDAKPISIIITTLAARVYGGESSIESALETILSSMGTLVSRTRPRVPNPVNLEEDFADRWATAEGISSQLERNFRLWLTQAKVDLDLLSTVQDGRTLREQSLQKFGQKLDEGALAGVFGTSVSSSTPAKVQEIRNAPRPWRM